MLVVADVEPLSPSGILEATFGVAFGAVVALAARRPDADAAALFGFEAAFGFTPFGLKPE